MALQHLRSSTASKRPTPASMADGQLAVNTAAASPGLFFKDAGGALIKTGPVHIGATAPNVTPASGGQAGNSIGEQWLDTSGATAILKVWDGSIWKIAGAAAAGTDTQIQFNDGGNFGSDVDLTYNKTTNKLTTGGDV